MQDPSDAVTVFKTKDRDKCGACGDGMDHERALDVYRRMAFIRYCRSNVGPPIMLLLCSMCYGNGSWIPLGMKGNPLA